jgi:hypothetical protein
MVYKRPLVPERIRRPPAGGWSWVDRRFLRQYASSLSREAILLYFFLAAVGDRHGLSFYADATIAVRLRLSEQTVVLARDELIRADLVAHQGPLTQVLSLPQPRIAQGGDRDAELIGETLRRLARGNS